MTINLTSVTNNQTFGTWLSRTNDLVTALSSNIVTVDSTLGGSISTGNGFVNGMFGANTLFATTIAGGNLTSNSILTITTNTQVSNSLLSVGNTSMNVIMGYLTTNSSLFEGYGNQNNYVQLVLTNSNTGTNASVDIALYDNGGIVSGNFIDLGISGSNYSNTSWTIGGGSDGYLYTGNTNLAIGTAGQKYINFFANGTLATNEVMRITSGANVGIGNTNPNARLQVTGTANISGNVYHGGTLIQNGNATLNNSAIITGNLVLSNTIAVTGAATLSNTINVTGLTTLSAVTVTAAANLSTIAVTGAANLSTIAVTGNTSLLGIVSIGSASATANLSVNGYVTIANNLTVGQQLNLSGNVTYTGTSTGNLVPTDSTYFLGTTAVSTKRWGLYATSIDSNSTINVTGAATLGSTLALTGTATLSANLSVTGNGTFSNTLAVTGAATFSNTLTTAGAASVGGNLTATHLSLNNLAYVFSNSYGFSSTANSLIDTFPSTSFRTAEYIIQAANSTSWQSSKVLVMHDGTTAYATEYAVINTSATPIISLSVTKASTSIQLYATPADASVIVNFVRTAVSV